MHRQVIASLVIALISLVPALGSPEEGRIAVRSLLPDRPIARAGRPAPVSAIIENRGDRPLRLTMRLSAPAGIRIAAPTAPVMTVNDYSDGTARWSLVASHPGEYDLKLSVSEGAREVTAATYRMRFEVAVPIRTLKAIPAPAPIQTSLLIGAHNCPLWERDKPGMWANILKHPERTPALGFYNQENPDVSDWETKWAVEHGVSYMIYCWYRKSQGGPVQQNFGSAIHEGLFKGRFGNKLKFTIMWENQARGLAGVSDEKDLMQNLLPFWINNYFKRDNYLKVDNKPVLFIYRPEFLVDDLGGVDKVVQAFDKMRAACKAAGFAGLTILGEYRGLEAGHLQLMKSLGLDYTFAYCWYVPNSPKPQTVIDTQMANIRQTQKLDILPQVITVSQAWSGWSDEGSIWKLPPADWERLLRQAGDFARTLPSDELGSKMLILDNWNEWGEGHYIAPYREYGFGYLDAVRNVFGVNAGPHQDLIPEDIGLGPYDTAIRTQLAAQAAQTKAGNARVTKPGADAPGLVAWWAFDEKKGGAAVKSEWWDGIVGDKMKGAAATHDYSGHRLGGRISNAALVPGKEGNALECRGGCAVIAHRPALMPSSELSIECWVRTNKSGQGNTWMLNKIYSGGTATGYRMGLVNDRPTFNIPQTDWSHHLSAPDPLPLGRWVHLAGTFDGKVMRLYVDGKEVATMDRPGPINPNQFPITLGNFEEKHAAYFTGLLDEVKLWSRALSPDEVSAHARAR